MYWKRGAVPHDFGYRGHDPSGLDDPGPGWIMCRNAPISRQRFVDRVIAAPSGAALSGIREAELASFPTQSAYKTVTNPATGKDGWQPITDPEEPGRGKTLADRFEYLAAAVMREVPQDWGEPIMRAWVRPCLRGLLKEHFAYFFEQTPDPSAALDLLRDDALDRHIMPSLSPWERWGLLLFALLWGDQRHMRIYPSPNLPTDEARRRKTYPTLQFQSDEARSRASSPDDPLVAVDWLDCDGDTGGADVRLPGDPTAVIQWPCEASAAVCYWLAKSDLVDGPGSVPSSVTPNAGTAEDDALPRPQPAHAPSVPNLSAGRRGKNIDAKMRKLLGDDSSRMGWTAEAWAERLDCSKSTVAGTDTWEQIRVMRERERIERIERGR
jgi:hypothetical protein